MTPTEPLLDSYSEQGDAANGLETQALMLVNSTFSGLLEAFDEDWVAVSLTAGQPVEIKVLGAESGMGTAADPLFALYDGEGEFLRTYYDNGESVEPRAFFTPQQSGTYYIALLEQEGRSGSYRLSVSTEIFEQGYPMDLADNSTTTASLPVNSRFMGIIDFGSDEDWISVDLEAGETVRIHLLGETSQMATLADPFFTLYDAREYRIGDYDDSGTSLDPDEIFTPYQSGTYYIAVSGYGSALGSYTLIVASGNSGYKRAANSTPVAGSLVQTPDQPMPRRLTAPGEAGEVSRPSRVPSQKGTTASLSVGDALTGFLEAGHEDWIAVQLKADEAVHIQLLRAASEEGALNDPRFMVYNSLGHLLGSYDDIKGDPGSDLPLTLEPDTQFIATESGTHYIAVSDYGNAAGTYRLSLTATDKVNDEIDDGRVGVTLQSGEIYSRTLEAGGKDWFSMHMQMYKPLYITVSGADSKGGTLSDPLLTLYDPYGNYLGVVGSRQGRDPALLFSPRSMGLHYIAISSHSGAGGSYRIVVVESKFPELRAHYSKPGQSDGAVAPFEQGDGHSLWHADSRISPLYPRLH